MQIEKKNFGIRVVSACIETGIDTDVSNPSLEIVKNLLDSGWEIKCCASHPHSRGTNVIYTLVAEMG